MPFELSVMIQRFPLANPFTISRGSKTEAVVVVVRIADGRFAGMGECVPYPRYGETPEGVLDQIEAARAALMSGSFNAEEIAAALPAGAARNAVDCAAWDFRAKRAGVSVAQTCGRPVLRPLLTCYTISLGTPEAMEQAARAASGRPLLKVKLGGGEDPARIAAVRRGAPAARLVVDANEGWTAETLAGNFAACRTAGVELVEQPLPAGQDAALDGMERPIPVCADESLHTRADLPALRRRYDAVNIKLDKTGGLTEALALQADARRLGMKIMIGSMVGSSLGAAPAVILGQDAEWVDLDGPLLVRQDRDPGLIFDGSMMSPPDPRLWG